tara:strand:- start:2925 stop:3194 length:270 start_codon:yes stop_codon:yes gene_type:complete
MEVCVREAYGSHNLLFGSFGNGIGVSGIKIAVTTMAVSNSRLCILSNYNGKGHRQGNMSEHSSSLNLTVQGYKHYRPSYGEEEILVRDA